MNRAHWRLVAITASLLMLLLVLVTAVAVFMPVFPTAQDASAIRVEPGAPTTQRSIAESFSSRPSQCPEDKDACIALVYTEVTALKGEVNKLSGEVRDELRGLFERLARATSGPPWWEFWVLVLLGLATLGAITAQFRRSSGASPLAEPLAESGTRQELRTVTARLQDQSKQVAMLLETVTRLDSTIHNVRAELRQFAALAATRAGAAAPMSSPSASRQQEAFVGSRPVPTAAAQRSEPAVSAPSGADQEGIIVRDFNAMVIDQGSSDEFARKWRPRSVTVANFDQRVRESGFAPELVVRDASLGGNDEHFWFVALDSSATGLILPARRLLMHPAALRGDYGARLFRMIFETVPSGRLMLNHAAYAEETASVLHIVREGSIALPS